MGEEVAVIAVVIDGRVGVVVVATHLTDVVPLSFQFTTKSFARLGTGVNVIRLFSSLKILSLTLSSLC